MEANKPKGRHAFDKLIALEPKEYRISALDAFGMLVKVKD